MRRLVIQPHRPWRLLFEILLLVIVASLVGRQLADAELHERSEAERSALENANARLAKEVGGLRDQNKLRAEDLAIQIRAQQVESKAREEVTRQLQKLQDRVFELREEVAFYRGIVANDQGKGLNIQTLLVERTGADDAYRFHLVLTRTMNGDKVSSGSVSISVDGERGGKPARLTYAELAPAGAPNLRFQFKYFQRLEGRIKLPSDFVPRHVLVEVDSGGDDPGQVEKTFDWSVAVS